jgi:hypothetical protein
LCRFPSGFDDNFVRNLLAMVILLDLGKDRAQSAGRGKDDRLKTNRAAPPPCRNSLST